MLIGNSDTVPFSCTFSTSADVPKPTQAPKQDPRAVILVLSSLTPGRWRQSTSSPADLACFVFLGWICFLHSPCHFYTYTPRPLGSSALIISLQINFSKLGSKLVFPFSICWPLAYIKWRFLALIHFPGPTSE